MLKPKLYPDRYVFCSTDQILDLREVIGFFREEEGCTYIILEEDAQSKKLAYENTWSLISLEYQSSLEMVGLTAVISTALAKEKIPCNIVAGYYHDHIFVPSSNGTEALHILSSIII